MQYKFKLSLIILVILAFFQSFSQQKTDEASSQTINPVKELQKDINSILNSKELNNSLIGISIYSLDKMESLFQLNNEINMIPASIVKLFTTAAALEYLGADYKYSTKLFLDGELMPSGEFFGNIVIKGNGDPTFSSSFGNNPENIFSDWINLFDSLGINSIVGYIIGDDNHFDDIYYAPGWSWDDIPFVFSAQVNSLNYNDNCVNFIISQSDSINNTAKITIFPPNTFIRVLNAVNTVENMQFTNISANREFGSNFIELKGQIAIDSLNQNNIEKIVTIENPTLFFLNSFKMQLEKEHIRFRGAILDIDDWYEDFSYSDKVPIHINYSKSLKDIIKVINKESHNLAAEILLKSIGKEINNEGSFDKGIDAINKFTKSIGIQDNGLYLVDGSGLSRFNMCSAESNIILLKWIYNSRHKEIFINSLAEPNKEGTLARRLKNSRAEKSIKAKTGSMNHINNISGYVTTQDGETLAFSIMIQNFTITPNSIQNYQDLILMRLAGFSRNY